MAFSTAVFMDPQGEARQILAAVLELLAARRAQDAARGVVPTPVPVVAEEEGPDEDPRAEDQSALVRSRAKLLELEPVLIVPGHGPAFRPTAQHRGVRG